MRRFNILWIYVDSVRRYHSTGDDRSRINFMDEFAKESVEFLNTVTSAPSTQMSISAMATSVPAYYIARNFSDYFSGTFEIETISEILRSHGYNIYGFLQSKRNREFNFKIFTPIERKYWPKKLSHSKYWNNSDINKAIDHTLNVGVQNPALFFVNYNCREDPETGIKVKHGLQRFRKAGYTENNTITILCSDHGYPDPKKETGTPEYYKKRNLTHDMLLTDDNIMIPLLIQYPCCPKGKNIETTVGSLDIYPSILDILGIDIKNKIHGKSLIPLVNGDDIYQRKMMVRFHRSDSRLATQSGRGTAIRNDRYKYIFYHDCKVGKGQEEFFALKEDHLEQHNLVYSDNKVLTNVLALFRVEFKKSERDASTYQLRYLFDKFSKRHVCDIYKAKSILITDSCSKFFIEMLIDMIHHLNDKVPIYVLEVENRFENNEEVVKIIRSGVTDWADLTNKVGRDILKGINIDIVFAPYNTSEKRDTISFTNFVKRVSAQKKIYLDYNMESFKKTLIGHHWRRFKLTWNFAKYEPFYIVSYGVELLIRRIKRYLKPEKWGHLTK